MSINNFLLSIILRYLIKWVFTAQNKNILVTGGGGTGKTFLTKEIKRQLMKQFPGWSEVIVVTPTWLAALQYGSDADAVTWQSITYFGKYYSDHRYINAEKRNRIIALKALIFDEVSMLSATMLDMIDALFRRVRDNDSPMGGVKVIFVGDFYQLGPIVSGDNNICPNTIIDFL